MWLKSALEDIKGGALRPEGIPDLPQGMGEMYRRHFTRFGIEAYRERLRPLMATLLVAEGAMSEDELTDLTYAFQAADMDGGGAIDAAEFSRKPMFLPAGTYLVNSTLHVRDNSGRLRRLR